MFLRLTTLENLRLIVVHALFIKQVPNLTNLLVIVHAVVFQISSAWIDMSVRYRNLGAKVLLEV